MQNLLNKAVAMGMGRCGKVLDFYEKNQLDTMKDGAWWRRRAKHAGGFLALSWVSAQRYPLPRWRPLSKQQIPGGKVWAYMGLVVPQNILEQGQTMSGSQSGAQDELQGKLVRARDTPGGLM